MRKAIVGLGVLGFPALTSPLAYRLLRAQVSTSLDGYQPNPEKVTQSCHEGVNDSLFQPRDVVAFAVPALIAEDAFRVQAHPDRSGGCSLRYVP